MTALAHQQLALLTAIVTGQPGAAVAPVAGLAIYHRAFHARLEECLADDYPLTRNLLGPATFRSRVRSYVGGVAPRRGLLATWGDGFPRHVATTDGRGSAVHDLARVEAAIVQAIHAPLVPGVRLEDLAAVGDGQDVRLHPVPSLRLLRCRHDTSPAWHHGQPPLPGACIAVVVRHPDGVLRRTLPLRQGRLLQALARGSSLGTALQRHPLPPDLLVAALRQAAEDRLFHLPTGKDSTP